MEYKGPNGVFEFTVDWTTELGGDTISTSAWTVETGITKDSDTNTTTAATIWLSGGTLGKVYKVTNRIVTAGARTFEQTWFITVQNLLV